MSFLRKLFGKGEAALAAPARLHASVEYNGFRIRPEPFAAANGHQTAGVIEKTVGDEVREHRFVRADTHGSEEAAAAFAIVKGKQIIDEQGERLFGPPSQGA